MIPSTRASRGALLLFAGGLLASAGSFLPWARMPVVSVRGTSTAWGVATLVAGLVGAVAGYRLARGHHAGRWTRFLVAAAALVAVAVPSVVAGEVHRSLVEDRLDRYLAPHGLTAGDVLGTDDRPSLLERYAPFVGGQAGELVAAVERSMTIRPDLGLWFTLAGGAAMAGGATSTAARRQRRISGVPEGGPMTTTNATTISVTGMTCGGCARRVRSTIAGLPGVTDVDVELATGTVHITSDTEIDETSVRTAVEAAGYEVAA